MISKNLVKFSLLLAENVIVLVFERSLNQLNFVKVSQSIYTSCQTSFYQSEYDNLPSNNKTPSGKNNPHVEDRIKKIGDGSSPFASQQVLLESNLMSCLYKDNLLFVLMEHGVVKMYDINTSTESNWCSERGVLIDHLKPPGWEMISCALAFQTVPRNQSESQGTPDSFLDMSDFSSEHFSLIKAIKNESEILVVAVCIRKYVIQKWTNENDSTQHYYESQLVLHKFSMNENALISSQILGTELVACELTFSKNFLIIQPTGEYFDKMVILQKVTSSSVDHTQHSSWCDRIQSAIWTVNYGLITTSEESEISVQTLLCEILDNLEDTETVNCFKIVRSKMSSDEVIFIDQENRLFWVNFGLSIPSSGRIPLCEVAKLEESLINIEITENNRILISYPSQLLIMSYPNQNDMTFMPNNKILTYVFNIENSVITNSKLMMFEERNFSSRLKLERVLELGSQLSVGEGDKESGIVSIRNCSLVPKFKEGQAKSAQKKVKWKHEDLLCITKRLSSEIKHEQTRRQLEDFVNKNESIFAEILEDEQNKLNEEINQSNENLTTSGRFSTYGQSQDTTNLEMFNQDAVQLKDFDLKQEIRQLILELNFSMAHRFFKLAQLADKFPNEVEKEIFNLIGFNTLNTNSTKTNSSDELTNEKYDFPFDDDPFVCSTSQLEQMFLQNEEDIFTIKGNKYKCECGIMPIFELVGRLIVATTTTPEETTEKAKSVIKFVVESINRTSQHEVSLFNKVSHEQMFRRFERIRLEEKTTSTYRQKSSRANQSQMLSSQLECLSPSREGLADFIRNFNGAAANTSSSKQSKNKRITIGDLQKRFLVEKS